MEFLKEDAEDEDAFENGGAERMEKTSEDVVGLEFEDVSIPNGNRQVYAVGKRSEVDGEDEGAVTVDAEDGG